VAQGTRLAVLMAGQGCPDAEMTGAVERQLGNTGWIPHARVAAAMARTRAERALEQARRLYTRTSFTGCISLLSISELELSRSLAEPDPALRGQAHRLLAEVMLWLGICQWASGEPQAASSSFVRSAQLPSSPTPDPRLLPPEVVEAYRTAVSAPRQQVTCHVDPPLRAVDLLVDGKGPTTSGDTLTVPAGSHYLVLQARCAPGPQCDATRQQLGPGGMRSLRLEAQAHHCRIQLPAVRPVEHLTCVNVSESEDVGFVAGVTRQVGAARTLVVTQVEHRLALRLYRAGVSGFQHQLVSSLGPGDTPARVVARSVALLLGKQAEVVAPPPGQVGPTNPWYTRWWVWALAGAGVAAITTTVVLVTTRDNRVRVVVGP